MNDFVHLSDPSTETEPTEIVVALEHAPLVMTALENDGLHVVNAEPSEPLGLTLVTLDPDEVPTLVGLPRLPAEPGRTEGLDDVVLARLRFVFDDGHAHWTPTMGKNRTVGVVTDGGGSISYGGGPNPTKAKAWNPGRSGQAGKGITIGVLDTALFPHQVLAGGYIAASPEDFVVEDGPYDYAQGHATFVTGLILKDAPGAVVRVRKVLSGAGTATSWEVANAIVELGSAGVDILNLSLVCYTEDGRPPLVLSTAIDRLPPHVLVIACAGNHGGREPGPDEVNRRPAWPAALDDVVAVGSVTKDGKGSKLGLSPFTPPRAAWIDVVTVGDPVVSTYFTGAVRVPPPEVEPAGTESGPAADGAQQAPTEPPPFEGWAAWSGTSFAAAKLTGRVAAVAEQKGIPVRAAYRRLAAKANATGRRPEDDLPPYIPT
ncbi:hypothetical protein Cch01nite_09280 [Cellulomonas chitinilytica]|uniref:Peptidase S8/S53 domain-containing protein n=1 Tax=Cellulomonas chitinilytica TaxID=398759 RepID=A0A919P332_9CELL|nr:S8/S53 family peptidase [Cellulomonas chitinilytica]GIG20204.1 hypothetical protein Cch01nite_09280 [Cellulomonas chitinilytica]